MLREYGCLEVDVSPIESLLEKEKRCRREKGMQPTDESEPDKWYEITEVVVSSRHEREKVDESLPVDIDVEEKSEVEADDVEEDEERSDSESDSDYDNDTENKDDDDDSDDGSDDASDSDDSRLGNANSK